MTTSVTLATIMTCLSVALRCSSPRKMFSPMAEAPMIRYEELELIEAAKMPETTTPHMKLGSRVCASTMKMVSASVEVSSSVGIIARPTKPMHTAQPSEITHQEVAMIRDLRTSSTLRMGRKRTSTCGIPK